MAPIATVGSYLAPSLLLRAREELFPIFVNLSAYLTLWPLRELDAREEHALVRLDGFLGVLHTAFAATLHIFE